MTGKPKREGPLKAPLGFDEAISRALRVKLPPEGWKEYERARARTDRRGPKPVSAGEDQRAPEGDKGE